MPSISAKELSAIEDQLSCEQQLIVKFRNFAAITQDPQIRSKCEQIASQHQKHYDKLLGHLS